MLTHHARVCAVNSTSTRKENVVGESRCQGSQCPLSANTKLMHTEEKEKGDDVDLQPIARPIVSPLNTDLPGEFNLASSPKLNLGGTDDEEYTLECEC